MGIYSILGIVLITCGVSLFIGAGIGFYDGVSKTEENDMNEKLIRIHKEILDLVDAENNAAMQDLTKPEAAQHLTVAEALLKACAIVSKAF